jgi:hypothetical protein
MIYELIAKEILPTNFIDYKQLVEETSSSLKNKHVKSA